jgi:hypothetical protein
MFRLYDWREGLFATLPPAGDDFLLVLVVFMEDDQPGGPGAAVAEARINGQVFEKDDTFSRVVADDGSTQNLVEIHYLRSAGVEAAGAAGTIEVTLSRTPTETPHYLNTVFSNVNQADPIGVGTTHAAGDGADTFSVGPVMIPPRSMGLAFADVWNVDVFTMSGVNLSEQVTGSSHTGVLGGVGGGANGTTATATFEFQGDAGRQAAMFVVLNVVN